tara:strand:+ start:5764 stop:6489 length:726 start_codon:yes stop_codon:yes gene_type:complete
MGKVVVLSGGSRGLGLHLVEHLLSKGCTICTFARNSTSDVERLEETHKGSFMFRKLDSRDIDGTKQYIRDIVERFGRIDGLVNNAAIGQDHLLVHMAEDIVRDILDINLFSPIMLSKEVAKQMMLQDDGGRIISISSICGTRGYPGLTIYSATKAALDSFSRSFAREVGERGILVNTLSPGFFESEMSSVLLPEQINTIKRRTPTKHMTTEENITPVLDLLLLEDTNITGESILIDGGISS